MQDRDQKYISGGCLSPITSVPFLSILSPPLRPFSTLFPCRKVAPEIQLRVLGERLAFPQRGRRTSPDRKRIFCVFGAEEMNGLIDANVIIIIIIVVINIFKEA